MHGNIASKFAILLAAILTTAAFAAPKERKYSLHVISYNIKGLPSFTLSSEYKDARYPVIGKLLSESTLPTGPSLVLLQEAFDSQTEALLKEAKFPHVAEGPGVNALFGVSSGLYILSRYPIVEKENLAFGQEHCLSWDCWANKGVQFARISVPGMPGTLEVFNTHLQAGRQDSLARQAQVKALLKFFREHHKEGNPVIFAGDFNFRPGLKQQSYLDFASEKIFSHAGKYCLEKGCSKVEDIGWHGAWSGAVDHQFYTNEGPVRILPVRFERKYREPVQSLKLSDHPTHEVHYELRWRET